MKLPITVVLPTRNAGDQIEAHLDTMAAWLPLVSQIVVVDSSEDDTLDRIRRRLGDGEGVEFHSRPRGLYEGWNYGVSRARETFVYFSTLGDALEAGGLSHLLAGIIDMQADVLVSPPRMVPEDPAIIPLRWPIHWITEHLPADDAVLLPPETAFLLATSFLPSTILGSSASNLYRRDFLVRNPFPEGWGHCADSAWMVSHALSARIAVTARPVAVFIQHARREAATDLTPGQHLDLQRRAAKMLASAALDPGRRGALMGWFEFDDTARRKLRQRVETLVHAVKVRDEQLVAAGDRLVKTRGDLAVARAEAGHFREKVLVARALNENYESRHRSLAGVIGLYYAAKVRQFHAAWNAAWKLVRR